MPDTPTSIPGALLAAAEKWPDRPALIDPQGGDWALSYRGLAGEVARACTFLQRCGLGAGSRFAIWAPNCPEWVIFAIAGQALGGVLVPLNTRYKGAEAADILRRSQCTLLLTVDGFLGHDYPAMLSGHELPGLKSIITMRGAENDRAHYDKLLEGCARQDLSAVVAKIDGNDLSDIIFTSGTTGAPKGAMTAHQQNCDVFTAFTRAIDLNADDRYLVINPFFHSFGYKAGWLSCVLSGAAIYPFAVFEADAVMRAIQSAKITCMPGAPTLFQSLLDAPNRAKYDLSSLRVATTGAATIPVDLIRRMHEELGIDHVYSAYGQTESCGVISLCAKGDDFTTIATTCGRALPGTELKVTDEAGKAVPIGGEGEIWVKGFHVMKGYLDNEQATRETITADGWLKTGDIGTIDARGYIKITDRKKDMVIVGGFNCYPAEIEQMLRQHPAVRDAAVIGAPDERMGEVTHAYIELSGDAAADDITAFARQHMANYKVPRAVHLVDALPRNASGKVQKFLLGDN